MSLNDIHARPPIPFRSAAETSPRRAPEGWHPKGYVPEVPAPRPPRVAAARAWLIGYLAANGGSAPSADIRPAAVAAGHKVVTLSAAKRPGIRVETIPGTRHRTRWVLTPDAAAEGVPTEPEPPSTTMSGASEWLVDHLASVGGRAMSADVKDAARRDGVNPRSLDRARPDAGVRVETVPGIAPRRTEWVLPDPDEPGEQPATADEWLADLLRCFTDGCPSADVKQSARACGYNPRTISRAAKRLGVRFVDVPGVFPRRTVWVLDPPAPASAP